MINPVYKELKTNQMLRIEIEQTNANYELYRKLTTSLVSFKAKLSTASKDNISQTPQQYLMRIGGSSVWQLINALLRGTTILGSTDIDSYAILLQPYSDIWENRRFELKLQLQTQFGICLDTIKGDQKTDFISFAKDDHDYTIVKNLEIFSNFQVLIDENGAIIYDKYKPSHHADFYEFIFNDNIICYGLSELVSQAKLHVDLINNVQQHQSRSKVGIKEPPTAQAQAFRKLVFVFKSFHKPFQLGKVFSEQTAQFFYEFFNNSNNINLREQIVTQMHMFYKGTFTDRHYALQYMGQIEDIANKIMGVIKQKKQIKIMKLVDLKERLSAESVSLDADLNEMNEINQKHENDYISEINALKAGLKSLEENYSMLDDEYGTISKELDSIRQNIPNKTKTNGAKSLSENKEIDDQDKKNRSANSCNEDDHRLKKKVNQIIDPIGINEEEMKSSEIMKLNESVKELFEVNEKLKSELIKVNKEYRKKETTYKEEISYLKARKKEQRKCNEDLVQKNKIISNELAQEKININQSKTQLDLRQNNAGSETRQNESSETKVLTGKSNKNKIIYSSDEEDYDEFKDTYIHIAAAMREVLLALCPNNKRIDVSKNKKNLVESCGKKSFDYIPADKKDDAITFFSDLLKKIHDLTVNKTKQLSFAEVFNVLMKCEWKRHYKGAHSKLEEYTSDFFLDATSLIDFMNSDYVAESVIKEYKNELIKKSNNIMQILYLENGNVTFATQNAIIKIRSILNFYIENRDFISIVCGSNAVASSTLSFASVQESITVCSEAYHAKLRSIKNLEQYHIDAAAHFFVDSESETIPQNITPEKFSEFIKIINKKPHENLKSASCAEKTMYIAKPKFTHHTSPVHERYFNLWYPHAISLDLIGKNEGKYKTLNDLLKYMTSQFINLNIIQIIKLHFYSIQYLHTDHCSHKVIKSDSPLYSQLTPLLHPDFLRALGRNINSIDALKKSQKFIDTLNVAAISIKERNDVFRLTEEEVYKFIYVLLRFYTRQTKIDKHITDLVSLMMQAIFEDKKLVWATDNLNSNQTNVVFVSSESQTGSKVSI